MYCRYCGKILTTADNLDRCYPSCPESLERKTGLMIPLQPYDYVALVKERDQLKVENERLKEALMGIYQLPNDSNIQYAVELVTIMQDRAQEALNEVAK